MYVGEMVTSVQRATLIPGGSESLVYTTLSGSIGVLVPFASNEVEKDRHVSIVER
jgi:splicing factor 3B subunit 3